jgi:UDP-glucuronate 4-epimerase
METVNLRLFAVYGPDLRQDCVPHLVATAIMKGKPFTVFGDGTSMRDYVEIRDVLSALDAACLGHESHAALNVGSGFGTTLLELIALLEKSLGKKAELVFKPPVPGELLMAVPDISLAMEKLNWEPRVSVEEGTARMAEWFKNPENVTNGNSSSSGKFSRPI